MTFSEIWSLGLAQLIPHEAGFSELVTGIILTLGIVLCVVIPYFLGGLNFAIILSKALYGEDIRKYGSGNAGTTNMLRTYGKKAAGLTLLGDMLKAAVSTALGFIILGINGGYLAGLFCILGHMFPIMYKFKGGKGVASVAAMILVSNPVVFAILLVLFVLIVALSRFVSLASVMCMFIYPWLVYKIDTWLFPAHGGGIYVIIAIIIAALIIFMHRENIKRLSTGKESRISFSKHTNDTEKKD